MAQLVNLSGGAVHLSQSGSLVYSIAPGFSGGVNLSGEYSAVVGGDFSGVPVATNSITQVTVVDSTGTITHAVFGTNSVWPVSAHPAPVGQILSLFNSGGLVVSWSIPSTYASVVTITGEPGAYSENWDYSGSPSNIVVYSSNFYGGADLGVFTAGEFTRTVEIGATAVSKTDFADHVAAFSWAFTLGLIIFFFRWGLNVLSAMGREEDL